MIVVRPAAGAGVAGLGPLALRALRLVLDALLVGLLAVVLGALVLARVGPLAGREPIVVTGGSMGDAVPRGSVALVAPVAPGEVRPGDVVAIGDGERLVVHRIGRVVQTPGGGLLFETKGDANPAPDPVLRTPDQVVGRVDAVVPLAGYLLRLLGLPSGIAFILGLAGLLVVGGRLLDDLIDDRASDALGRVAGPSPADGRSPPPRDYSVAGRRRRRTRAARRVRSLGVT